MEKTDTYQPPKCEIDLSKYPDLIGVFNHIVFQTNMQIKLSNLEEYKKNTDREKYLADLYKEITDSNSNIDEENKILRITSYIQNAIFQARYVPRDESNIMITDPLINLDMGWGSCGTTNRVLVDLSEWGGVALSWEIAPWSQSV